MCFSLRIWGVSGGIECAAVGFVVCVCVCMCEYRELNISCSKNLHFFLVGIFGYL